MTDENVKKCAACGAELETAYELRVEICEGRCKNEPVDRETQSDIDAWRSQDS